MQIVAVQISEDLRRAQRKPLVERVGLAEIWLAHPTGEPPLVASQDGHGPIAAPAVDHDVLEAGQLLVENRAQGLFNELTLIEAGGDDRDRGSGHQRPTAWAPMALVDTRARSMFLQ